MSPAGMGGRKEGEDGKDGGKMDGGREGWMDGCREGREERGGSREEGREGRKKRKLLIRKISIISNKTTHICNHMNLLYKKSQII